MKFVKKHLNYKTTLATLALASACSTAHAVDLTVVGTGTIGGGAMTALSPYTITTGAPVIGYGTGILADVPLVPGFELETGLIYFTEGGNFSLTGALPSGASFTTSSVISSAWLRIPALIHYSFMPMFAVGLGGYYAHGTGNITGTQTASGASSPISLGFEAFGLIRDDYGLMGDLTFNAPLVPSFLGLYSSFKVAYGLVELANPANSIARGNFFSSFKHLDFTLYAGLKFTL